MRNSKKLLSLLYALFFLTFTISAVRAQPPHGVFALSADALQNGVELSGVGWKYQAGDDLDWAQPAFDDSNWDAVEKTEVKPDAIPPSGWSGRAWFRLRVRIGEELAGKNLALVTRQTGASEIYIDGEKVVEFGKLADREIAEYNPNRLPIPFRFNGAGEHVIAVRFASHTFADMSRGAARWASGGGYRPGIYLTLREADDLNETIRTYANGSSMRLGFLFIGILVALGLLHFLLYIFYRVERANLFYSLYAAAFAMVLVSGNLMYSGHQSPMTTVVLSLLSRTSLAATFIALLSFLHVAFGRRPGKLFWSLMALWAFCIVLQIIVPGNLGALGMVINIAIGLTFTFCFLLLIQALREKRAGAPILMFGLQILSLAMFLNLVNQLKWFDLPAEIFGLSEIAMILSIPLAVSIFLARNFARTSRDLTARLREVEELSQQKIEHERHAAELRAENERRAQELEEARQLQLSMLPKKLPAIAGLEIAAYMKPATEVGGDYYDFHISKDGTLTVAVGDATGHGLKAGSVVTATKSLFNAFAEQTDIPQVFTQMSGSLKKMNLRGLFMAMAMLKFKDGAMTLCVAGMPSVLIFRAESETVEEISLRAMPLGSISKTVYREREFSIGKGDCVVLMSDGFPEMFNPSGEMLGFEKTAEILPQIAANSPQEIIDHLVETGESWAAGRAQDDDVTFVVLKIS